MKNITKNIFVLLAVIGSLAGCKKLDLAPEDRFTDANYWSSSEKAKSVLNTAYQQMFSNTAFFTNEAMSDNAYMGRGDDGGASSLANGTFDPSLARLRDEWNDRYKGIKTCHILLENIDKVPNMDEALKIRMKAEARFVRAFHYAQLITWFGDVPLLQKDVTLSESLSATRTPKEEVLAFILKEYDEVARMLPVSYGKDDLGRITRGAALGMKARILLYENRWQEVVSTCEAIMSSGSYSLFPSYEGVFLPQNENNNEVLLDLQFVPELRTWNNMVDMAPLSVKNTRLNAVAPTQELVDSYIMTNGKRIQESASGFDAESPYSNRDPRMSATVVYHGFKWLNPDGTTQIIYIKPGSDPDKKNRFNEYEPGSSKSPTGYYVRKYFDPTNINMNSGLNLILLRYADVLLMYAEAQNEIGKLNQADWDKTIKPVRARAGFTDNGALSYQESWSQADLRNLIRNERRAELAMEGLRIFDIRRWRTAEVVLNGYVHGARFGAPDIDNGYIRLGQRTFDKNRHYLWPVPAEERELNKKLTQNPGWF